MNCILRYVSLACVLATVSVANAGLMTTYNLNNGMLINDPMGGDLYGSNVIGGIPAFTLGVDEVEEIWIDFTDGVLKQHLELADSVPVSGPDEEIFGQLELTGRVQLDVILSGVTGQTDDFGVVSNADIPIFSDVTTGDWRTNDLSDGTFYFHDIHFRLENIGGVPIDFGGLIFGAEANTIQIGTWPPEVPEPTSLAIFGCVVVGGLFGPRRRHV